MPVIFLNDVATGLISHLTGAISGGSLYRKSSFLLDHLGKQVLPDWFQISERPHLLKRLASTPFDSEGCEHRILKLFKMAYCKTYLLTSYSGRKMGMQSTGHAGGIHNWLVKPNLTGIDRTFTSDGHWFIGYRCHGARRKYCDGDYSRGAAGFWVENGEIQYPVAEITIAGQLQDMLKNIVAVADDIEHRSNIQTGSILLDKMKISGN